MARKKRPQIHNPNEIVIGARFGRLTVIDIRSGNEYHNRQILCKCDCGKEIATTRYNLCHGQESCSCKQYEDNRILSYKHGMGGTRKGNRHDRFYNIFYNIKGRTSGRPLRKQEQCYEGIKCLWMSFEDFKNDMYESYVKHVEEYGEKNTTIDRIDSYGDYCKENCRRATCKEQRANRRK